MTAPAGPPDVADLPGLDLDRLSAHLDRVAPGLVRGPLRGSVLTGGRSNLTYTVTDGTHRWVLRRPPLGHVLATAHDMTREYRVMAALGPARVRALVEALVDTLADLHAVVPREVGLADFGRPDGYNERQVRRWKRQLDGSRSRAVPGIDELAARLSAAVPPISRAAIVHGDYRLDNVMADGCRVRAVLDWEMSTLGDPLADLALMLMYAGRELPAIDGPARSPLPYPATLAPTSWPTGTPPGPAGTSATCAGTSRSRTSNSP